jgi:DNA-binding response OmpR family regulator
MKKIVLIEDDADLYSLIQYNLEKDGSALPDRAPARALSICAAARNPTW